MSKSKFVLAGLASAALLVGSATLNAGTAPEERSAAVQFSDLNLSRPGDVAQLFQRISAAADHICSSRIGVYDTLYRYQGCVADAVEKAIDHVNRPALTEFYRHQQTQDGFIKVARQ